LRHLGEVRILHISFQNACNHRIRLILPDHMLLQLLLVVFAEAGIAVPLIVHVDRLVNVQAMALR